LTFEHVNVELSASSLWLYVAVTIAAFRDSIIHPLGTRRKDSEVREGVGDATWHNNNNKQEHDL